MQRDVSSHLTLNDCLTQELFQPPSRKLEEVPTCGAKYLTYMLSCREDQCLIVIDGLPSGHVPVTFS